MKGCRINSANHPGAPAASGRPAPVPSRYPPPAPGEKPGVPTSREDLAALLFSHRGLLLAHIRSVLRPAGLLSDAADVFSSVVCRLDGAMLRGKVRFSSESKFWACIGAITRNTAYNHLRRARLERSVLAAERPRPAACLEARSNEGRAALLRDVLASLGGEANRELAFGRLRGLTFSQIALETGRSEVALRQRWSVIRRRLQRMFRITG